MTAPFPAPGTTLASDHTRCAYNLMAAGQYNEADTHYDLVLVAARQAGDKRPEGTTLQRQSPVNVDYSFRWRRRGVTQRSEEHKDSKLCDLRSFALF